MLYLLCARCDCLKTNHAIVLLLLTSCEAATFPKHFRFLNIVSVHSMQVASFVNRWAQNEHWNQGHELWFMLDETRTPSWVHAVVTLVGCAHNLPHPWKHSGDACFLRIQMYIVHQAAISHIKYLDLCHIKMLDYIMRRQKLNARYPILFVRAWHEGRLSCFDKQHWISSAMMYFSSICLFK